MDFEISKCIQIPGSQNLKIFLLLPCLQVRLNFLIKAASLTGGSFFYFTTGGVDECNRMHK
jgi:hypothetical protein